MNETSESPSTGSGSIVLIPSINTERERRMELRSLRAMIFGGITIASAALIGFDFIPLSKAIGPFVVFLVLLGIPGAIFYAILRRGTAMQSVRVHEAQGIRVLTKTGEHRVDWPAVRHMTLYLSDHGTAVGCDLVIDRLGRKCRFNYLQGLSDAKTIMERCIPREAQVATRSESSMVMANRLRRFLIPLFGSATIGAIVFLLKFL